MNNYLAVITTVLVITQIIRLIQNMIQLHRHAVKYELDRKRLSEMEVTREDVEMQKKAYRLIVEKLSAEVGVKNE